MSRLNKRIADLEQRIDPPMPKRWHQIVVRLGQTEDMARAAYEAEHGPLGDDPCIVFRAIQEPMSCPL